MPEDRSLDEFAAAADADATETGTDGEETADAETDGEDGDSAVDPATVAPAEATYDHSPDGAACAACGETVTRRWRDDPGYVCEDCKEW
ncbi:DUF7573 domain-containing protein [Halobaculum marinum]|uniref:DUF7573 domain-containing protein n=1 Tax=Halobaculum marinum TaxID=3031996 RepID=A0ABD5WYJ1_9EURY|nr:hypothetical protein [Halobaculum sp. DT55]